MGSSLAASHRNFTFEDMGQVIGFVLFFSLFWFHPSQCQTEKCCSTKVVNNLPTPRSMAPTPWHLMEKRDKTFASTHVSIRGRDSNTASSPNRRLKVLMWFVTTDPLDPVVQQPLNHLTV